jgi:hypothetical protein
MRRRGSPQREIATPYELAGTRPFAGIRGTTGEMESVAIGRVVLTKRTHHRASADRQGSSPRSLVRRHRLDAKFMLSAGVSSRPRNQATVLPRRPVSLVRRAGDGGGLCDRQQALQKMSSIFLA